MIQRSAGSMASLFIGLVTTAAVLLLLSNAVDTWTVTLAVNVITHSGSGISKIDESLTSVTSVSTHRSAAEGSFLCHPDGLFTFPLTISLVIRDTLGPRRLTPDGYSHYDFHRGVDWRADEGTPVFAVTSGTVRASRDDWTSGAGSGNFVHLMHKDIGCETRYNHLGEVYVLNGEVVTPGRIIGRAGSTGATYPHLHFEVRQGLTVTQRSAIHPLSTTFLPWTNRVSPTIAVSGVYTDATGMTALVDVTSPFTEPDVTAVSVGVSAAIGDPLIDYLDLNANTSVVADLDDPLVNDVCIIPTDLNEDNDYRVTMAFRRLSHGPTATVTARVSDVNGWGSTDVAHLIGGLRVTPPEQVARGAPGQDVTLIYTLTNRTGAADTFTLTHLSAQGWPAVVIPPTPTLASGQSRNVTVLITVNTDQFGPPDCGLLVAEAQGNAQQVVAGFYRIYRDAYVSAENGDDHPGCGAPSDPCAHITYGISQTDAGGTVHVAQGTYFENLVLEKTVDLLGGYGLDWSTRTLAKYTTTVDGDGSGPVLVIDGDYGPLVEGFTFVNGYNRGHAGGGVRLVGGAAPTLRSTWILSNAADLSGGGIYVGPYGTQPPTIINNTITDNRSGSSVGGGGGIYVKDRPALIQGNVISANQATANDGGGIYLSGSFEAEMLGNLILNNEATDDGGGVLVRSSAVYLANNVIAGNQADGAGSGLYIHGSSPYLLQTTIAGNSGGDGSGIYVTDRSGIYSDVTLTNTILVSHRVGITVTGGNTATLDGVLWYSNTVNYGGDGIITVTNEQTGNPAFSTDGHHLTALSAAIDKGVQVDVNEDIDGAPRPTDGDCNGSKLADLGADEYYGCIFLPMVFKNHISESLEHRVQGCLDLASSNSNQVAIHVEGSDVVMMHYSAIYNCCADIVVDLIDERPLLKLIEREIYPAGVPCTCLCPYDISARILHLPAGNYRVEVWNWDQSQLYGWAEVTVP